MVYYTYVRALRACLLLLAMTIIQCDAGRNAQVCRPHNDTQKLAVLLLIDGTGPLELCFQYLRDSTLSPDRTLLCYRIMGYKTDS